MFLIAESLIRVALAQQKFAHAANPSGWAKARYIVD
jgi:hypothetical protein